MVVIAIAVVLILAGFGSYYVVQTRAPKSLTETITITIPEGEDASAVLSPQNFTVMEGQHVTLVVDNMDNTSHTLAIPAEMETPVILPGQVVSVSFIPNEVGVFPLLQPPLTGPCATYSACNLNQGYVTVVAR
jgi:hypothetical protein